MANESKITYVLALDATKVTEGFKKVQESTALVDKNLRVIASDLGKIGENTGLTKAASDANVANQNVLAMAKAMQTLKETATRDYAARAIHSQDIVKLLNKEKEALEGLRKIALQQTPKGTFSQGLADVNTSLKNIQQQIDYHDRLAKSMEKELYTLEEITRKKKLLAELDANARKKSAQETGINFIKPADILGLPKGRTWKASDILTANEVKILEDLEAKKQAIYKQSIQAEVARRAELAKLAEKSQLAYNIKFIQQRPTDLPTATTSAFLKPPAKWKPYEEDLKLIQQAKEKTEKSLANAVDNLAKIKQIRQEQEAEWKKTWDAVGKANWEAIQAKGKAAKAQADEIKKIDADLSKQAQAEAQKRIAIAQEESLQLRTIARARAENNQKFMFGTTPSTGLKASDMSGLATLVKQEEEALKKTQQRQQTYLQEAKTIADTKTNYIKQKLAEEEQAAKAAIAKEVQARQIAADKIAANAVRIQNDIAKSVGIGQKVSDKEVEKILEKFASSKFKPYTADLDAIIAKQNILAQQSEQQAARVDAQNKKLGDEVTLRQQIIAKQKEQWAEQAKLNMAAKQTATIAQFAPKSGVIGTATTPVSIAPFTSQAAQQASQSYNAATKAAANYQTQLNAANLAVQNFNLAMNFLVPIVDKLVNGFNRVVQATRTYRQGISDVKKTILEVSAGIRNEIAQREYLRQAYANLHPELKKAAIARLQEKQYLKDVSDAYRTFQDNIASAKSAQEVQKLTNDFRLLFSTLDAGYKKAVADGNLAIQNYKQQQAAVEQLRKVSLASIDRNQANFASSGRFAYLQGTGASTQEVQMQKLRDTIAKTEAAYAKLVARTKEKLGATDDPNKIAKITQHYDRWSAKLSEINNKNQTLLGNVEKLTGAHKPLLERIFDLVVGYRLINSAVNTFTNTLRSVPNMGLQYETTYATLKATFSVTAKVNEELKFLDQLAQEAGISIDSLRTSFVEFAASAKFSGEKVENINEIFANISKAGMVLHLPADKMKSAFTALNQMYAKNQVMMEELKRQLGNQLPAAVNIFALSMGKTTRQLMDDMKKGLVVPKETILNFSRTYAAIFADPASMAYASQGVNASIQRLSTAWTNFATKIYEESKGLIKGGLSIATEAIDTLANHMTLLKNVATVTMTVMGVGLVTQLGRATLAMMATRNAAVAAAGAMSALTGVSATAGGVSALSTIGTYFKNIFLSIPSWVKIVAVIGTAVMALKDLEVGSVKVTSALDKLNGKALEVEKSITVSDLAIASWDLLYEKAKKYWDGFSEWYSKNSSNTPMGNYSALQTVGNWLWENAPLRPAYQAVYEKATETTTKAANTDLIAKQTELLNEKIKETLLAGTSGTVDETLAGVNKVVTTALGRIDKEFNATVAKIKGKTDIETIKLQGAKTNIALLEKEGAITATDAAKKKLAIQEKIYKLQMDAIDAEIKALEDKIKKEEAISQAQIDKSREATAYQEAYKNLGIKQSFRQEIPKSLVEIGAYKSIEDAATALQNKEAYKLQDTTIQRAIDQYNATHPNQGFKALEDVSEAAMKQANENTVKTWKIYEAKMDAHASILNRVSEGVIETNRIAEEERKLFEQLVSKLAPSETTTTNTNLPVSVLDNLTKPIQDSSFVSSGLSNLNKTLDNSNKRIEQYANHIRLLSAQYGVDANLVKAMIAQESSGITTALSSKGAAGLMQLMPATAKRFGVTNRNDPLQSIEGGIKYLAFLQDKFKGNVPLMLAGYNAGEGAVAKYGNAIPPYKETQEYVKRITAMYQPSASSIKSGELKSEDATLESINKLKEKQLEKEAKGLQNQIDKEAQLREDRLAELDRINTALQNTFSLTKTRQEQELAKLQTSAVPLSETQLIAQTAAIKTKFAPELTKQMDAVIANVQEKLGRTVEEGTRKGLQAEIVNLEKERAAIQAEALQAKVTVAINKVIPLQTALERKQFEIQKSLEDSLGLFNEQTFKLNQQIGQEETLKLLATEKERLKDKSNGLTQEEINKNTQLIALAEKQIAQLNQIELIKARIARDRELSASTRELVDAESANLPLNRASRMGVSGGFVGAIATEEAANYKYAEKMASYQQDITRFQAEQNIAKTTTEWNKLQTQIEQTTSAMYDLSLAKDAVLNQAVADTMDSISGHFVAWANGAEKAKDAFRGIAIDFAKMVQEIIMNELKMLAVKGIMSLITGGFSGGGSVGSLAGLGSTGATSAVGLFGYASGGQVSGKGTGTSDSIPAIVPIGSYVLNAKATSKAKRNRLINLSHGEVVFSPEQAAQIGLDNLERMNKQNFASGGLVGGTTTSTSAKAAKQNSNVYNINVAVPEGTSNAKQFGNEVGLEIMKAVAREEAKKQVNQYNKLRARG